jgi:hypothetical protein
MSKSILGSAPRVLVTENSYQYRVLSPEFSDRIVSILSEGFAREPMGAALDLSPEYLAPLFARFIPECTANGLSVMATPIEEPETVAGVFLCRDFKSPFPEGILQDFPRFAPIAGALGTVDEAYESQRPGIAIGDAVDLLRLP